MDCEPAVSTTNEDTTFAVGDAVVHPHHGAGRIVSRRRRGLLGAPPRTYLEIELAHSSLRISVPCETARMVGLRAVVDRRQLARIVEVLQRTPEEVPAGWPARQKHYRALLQNGDVLDLAAVVRDLAARHAGNSISPRERELHERSQRILASELCYALDVDAEHAAAFIAEHAAAAPLALA